MLGGKSSETFKYFKLLLWVGLMELRKHVQDICLLVEIMMEESDLPCFAEFDLKVFRSRFLENSTDKEVFKIFLHVFLKKELNFNKIERKNNNFLR